VPEVLLIVGILVAIFVGFNIGGSTTGPAFGPAVGANVITKVMAAGLMSIFFFVGAYTIGPQVVDTLGNDLVTDTSIFTMRSNVAVLFFIGGALFVGNYAGVPASTSMTAVGAIAALGMATGELDLEVLGEIVIWWVVAPISGFWVAGVVGRYFYPRSTPGSQSKGSKRVGRWSRSTARGSPHGSSSVLTPPAGKSRVQWSSSPSAV